MASYVAMKKKQLYQDNSCRLPLEHNPGEAQVDFGKADFYENGRKYEGAYLNVSFPYSNAGYTQLFKGENQEVYLKVLKPSLNILAVYLTGSGLTIPAP